MVEPVISDLDPLGSYSYTNYNYSQYTSGNGQYPQAIKAEQLNPYLHNKDSSNIPNSNETNQSNDVSKWTAQNTDTSVDIKPEISKVKVKKEKKNGFVSEKITEDGFPFYGCAVCNIRYSTLRELDSHVTTHKDRITSYDLRIKNQLKKKKLKKEQKKLKKLKKEKNLDPEIKPEDGYIGNEKASEFTNNNETEKESKFDPNDKNVSNESCDSEKKQELMNLQKIYKCFACQKQFSLSYYLKLHVRSHTDEKPYTCEQCGQSFITASKLGRHNKRFHLSVQYQCRICYRQFYRFELLTRHFDKKHAEDKLEGEPYDFNAILPYLKELEEQLREKQEAEKAKPKTEDLWTNEWPNMPSKDQPKDQGPSQDQECAELKACKLEIDIEEVKVSMDGVEIKQETEDQNDCADNDGIAEDDIRDDLSVKDNDSDSDYFPSNTWTSKIDSPPPSPPPTTGTKCPVCDKRLSTASYMRVHMRTHTGERPYKCYVCGFGFITASKMHRHVLTHPEAINDDSVKKENVDAEIKCEGEEDSKQEVKKAVKKLSKKLTEKKTKKYRKRPHACEYCHKRFLHLDTLQIHKKSHEGEQIQYRCHFCLLEVQCATSLHAHEATHAGQARPYVCSVCGKCYKKRESMIYHRKNHKPEREYICDICTKSFSARCKLQRHIISHSVDKYILKYECPVCAHMFNTKYHVQMHLATHQREGVIQEENRNEILAMVLQNARKIPKKGETHNLSDVIPSDERSRVCNICGEVFQHFYYLEEHLKSHGSKIAIENIDQEEEKKYICNVCNKGFKLHYYLKLHSFTHTKEKPFICQQCGKGFITRGKLKRHLETHTGLKKYQCHICYKFFTRPSYLRIHVRTIHGTQLVRLDSFGLESHMHA
ncbi:unnamed protein product [Colias eurytheme]|nr:unnamed protein product [Colias eurytheme]